MTCVEALLHSFTDERFELFKRQCLGNSFETSLEFLRFFQGGGVM